MRYPKGHLTFCQQLTEYICQILMLKRKCDLFFYGCSTMAAVLLYGIFQSLKTFLCIMEILYRFMQSLCRVIC